MSTISETRNDGIPGSGSLLSVLAHDLNNVLGGVTGALSLIEFEKEDSPDLHNPAYDSYLDILEKSSLRASGIVRQLLVLTRQPTDRSEIIPLAESLERLAASLQAASGTGPAISMEAVPGEARIRGNSIRFEKLILRILLTGHPGRQPDGGKILLSVYPGNGPSGKPGWRLKILGIECGIGLVRELAAWYGPDLDFLSSSVGVVDLGFPADVESI